MIEKKAYEIATRSLRKNYKKNGIFAGSTHFSDYWARDSFYSSLGALELGDYAAVRRNLELFLSKINKDGQVPLRIGASSVVQVLKFFGHKPGLKLKATYQQDKLFSLPQDQNSLVIIAFDRYIEKTGDHDFLRENFYKLTKIMFWNASQTKKGLIHGGDYATWADSVKKFGYTSYNNVLFLKALKCMSKFSDLLKLENPYEEKYESTLKVFNKKFWNGHYFVDYVNIKPRNIFSTDSNMLAIMFELTSEEQSKRILDYARKAGISKEVPSLTNDKKYRWNEVFEIYHIFGVGDYHNRYMCWLFLGCWHAIALNKAGRKDEAKRILQKLAKIIVKYNNVYEVYEPNGKIVKRLFYRSEQDFSWSASQYILAYNLLMN